MAFLEDSVPSLLLRNNSSDPLADIRVLQGGQHLAMVIKDGRVVDLNGAADTEPALALAASVQA
jgi:hypothetical protein